MSFPPKVKEEALVRSRRHCSLCQEFAGVFTNVHHIIQEADGGPNTIDNAIVLCLRCHGEVGHYNSHHPIGNKYSPSELRKHRDEWWKWCENNPTASLPKSPISVSPTSIELVSGQWKTKGLLTIHNKVDAVYYDVWVRMSFDLVNLSLHDLDIADIILPQNVVARAGPVEVRGDALMYLGTDSKGKPLIYLLLMNVAPRGACTFGLFVTKDLIAGTDCKARVTVNVESFDTEPKGRFMQMGDNKVAWGCQMPESFTISSLVWKTGTVGPAN